MKVMVYHEEPQKKDYYARIVQAVAVKLTIPCEVHGLLSWQAVKPLLDEPEAFDVYLLQGSRAGLKLALQIRAQTCVPAIIFLEAASVKLSDILRFRPSGVQLADSSEEVVLALKHSYLECRRRKKHLVIRSKEAVYRLPFSEITYLESCQRLIIVHTKRRQLQFYGKLADVLSTLPADQFVRCHQSYVVNLEKTQDLNKGLHYFKLADGEQVEISKAYYRAASEQFEAFLNR